MTFTPVELVTIAHACEDYAGNWYGKQGGFTFGRSDCERYVSEGHLGKLCERYSLKEVWAAVREHLDAHPEILAVGRLTEAQRAERQSARNAAAKVLLDEAHVVFDAGRFAEALELIERAELEAPTFERWDVYRRIISSKLANVESQTVSRS